MIAVEIVETSARLAELELPWWGLFHRVGDASPFQSPAWLLSWAECFAQGSAVRAIVVRSARGMHGIMPLVVDGRTARWLGHGISDYLDALVDPMERDVTLRRLSEGMRELAREVDVFDLTDVPEGTPLSMLELRDFAKSCEPGAVCPKLSLDRDCLALLPAWLRRNLRQGDARLARAGETHRVADGTNVAALVESFFEVHGARWQARGQRGVVDDASVRAFHRRAAPRLLERGLLELSTSHLEDKAVAAAYVLVRRDAHLYLTGFDPAFERFSLGSVLIGRSIARAVDSGRRHYDFLRGAEPYKYAWGATDSRTTQVRFQTAARPALAECRP